MTHHFDHAEPGQPSDLEPTRDGRLERHLLVVLLALFVMWTVKIYEHFGDTSLAHWGLYPRTLKGLVGVVTMPFLHGDFDHIFSNSFGIFTLGWALQYFYEKAAMRVVCFSVLASGLLVWIFARESYHIGASAVIYSLSAYIFVSGILRRDRKSIGAALIVAFLFGASIWGMLPFQKGISWEGHLFGALAGAALAFRYRNLDPPPVHQWEDEWDEEDQAFDSRVVDYGRYEPLIMKERAGLFDRDDNAGGPNAKESDAGTTPKAER